MAKRGAEEQITKDTFGASSDDERESSRPTFASEEVLSKRKILKPRGRNFSFKTDTAAVAEKPSFGVKPFAISKPSDDNKAAKLKALGQKFVESVNAVNVNQQIPDFRSIAKKYIEYYESVDSGKSTESKPAPVSYTFGKSTPPALSTQKEEKEDIQAPKNPFANIKTSGNTVPPASENGNAASQNKKSKTSSDSEGEESEDEKKPVVIKGPTFTLSEKPTVKKSPFSFGPKAAKKPSSDSDSDSDIEIKGPTFTFNKTIADPVFKVGAAKSQGADSKQTGFSFGSSSDNKDNSKDSEDKSEKSKDNSSGKFSFGNSSSASTSESAPKPAFSFGAKSAETAESKPVGEKPAFSFGSKPETTENKPAFSFGSKPATTENKPAFSFGSKPETTENKPAFSFGSKPDVTDSKPAFSFGNKTADSTGKPAFSFSAKPNEDSENKPSISFGTTNGSKPAETGESKPAFSFGSKPTENTESKPAFSFGSKSAETNESKPAFSFGSKSVTGEPTPAFSFGSKTSETPESKPAFSFGTTPSTEIKQGETKPAFSFGSSQGKDSFSSSSTGFSFGSGATFNTSKANTASATGSHEVAQKPLSFGFSKPAEGESESKETKESEEKVEEEDTGAEFAPIASLGSQEVTNTGEEDENVVYQRKSKLMLYDPENKESPYKNMGVGELKLLSKKDGSSSRILVRADGGLRVLLNILVLKDVSYATMGNGSLVRAPAVNSEGKIETYVLKVKTPADGKELCDALNQIKNS
ncbi:putative nucleoporin [Clavispora lusitaniae]|uniref:Nucleoporin n=1 Tax=Clavispora lusitaniae TaxID=36911 RepID=A0AA91PVC5_CLALS|nr:putative nucleoporin [Clavispora lusitaniae]